MKKLYIAPETLVLAIAEDDVIRTSLTKNQSNDPSDIGPSVGYGDNGWY